MSGVTVGQALQYATESFDAGDDQKSLAWCDLILEAHTNNDQALHLAAKAYRRQGNQDKAISYYKKCLEMAPRQTEVHNEFVQYLNASKPPEYMDDLILNTREIDSDILASRYLRVEDNGLLRYTSPSASLTWDFIALRWWSRIFEYRWMMDCLKEHFGTTITHKTAVDVGTGLEHPGLFMLKDIGFGNVTATDLFPDHPLLKEGILGIQYKQHDMTAPLASTYSAVVCISVVEHLPPPLQEKALQNLANAVEPGGALVLTFDIPGVEYDTNLELYKNIIRASGLIFHERSVLSAGRLTSLNGVVRIQWARPDLFTYRLYATRSATSHK